MRNRFRKSITALAVSAGLGLTFLSAACGSVTSPQGAPGTMPAVSAPSPQLTSASTVASAATPAPATSASVALVPAGTAPVPSDTALAPSAGAAEPVVAVPTSGQVLELRGDDLGVTAVGASRDDAVAALTAVLGAAQADPADDSGCASATSEVAWPQFRVAFDAAGHLTGWASTSRDITTPSGIAVGTTVARLGQVYGDELQVSASDSETGDTYGVEGVTMVGYLSGTDGADRVVTLRNGSCTYP
ncbi:MAG: hypothetical protein ACRYF3_01320 [Janthinobacterium lividum]